jgi:hypothetical protein
MKKIKFIVPFLAFALFSCDNYLDINSPSPNDMLFTQASPAKLLPGAETSCYRVQATTLNQLGNVFMNSWTRNVQSWGNGYDNELKLDLNTGFYSGIASGSTSIAAQIKNFQAIIDYPNPTGQYDNYVAAAKICKVHYVQQLVDLYGDIPYSEAWKGIENITPKYDTDYSIYKALFKELADARALIASPSATADDIAAYDVMLAGDMTKWNEFANTLQLRMCLRMSEVTNATLVTLRTDKLQEIAAGPFLSTNVTVNPGFNSSTDDQASPAFGNFAYLVTGTAQQNRTFITMTGHAYKALQSYGTTNWAAFGNNYEIVPGSGINYPNVLDPRSAKLFSLGAGTTTRRAVTQGSTVVDVTTPTGTLPGLPCRLGLAGNFNLYNLAPGGTLPEYFACPGYVMTLSESYFLQAEAALRYPGLFSGAQTSFESGITEDFLMRNAGSATGYIGAITAKANFGWTGSNTQKLHAIMYQKWIALMGVNAIQSYFDYTRTGFPVTPVPKGAIVHNRKPYRLMYTSSEYAANSANVPGGTGGLTSDKCFELNTYTPFWVPGATKTIQF